MKKTNPFLTLGTVGITTTLALHVCTTLLFTGIPVKMPFMILYPLCLLSLAIGFKKILKERTIV